MGLRLSARALASLVVLLLLGTACIPGTDLTVSQDRILDSLSRWDSLTEQNQFQVLVEIDKWQLAEALPAIVAKGLFASLIRQTSLQARPSRPTYPQEPPVLSDRGKAYELLADAAWEFAVILPERVKTRSDFKILNPKLTMAMSWLQSKEPLIRCYAAAWLYHRRIPTAAPAVLDVLRSSDRQDHSWIALVCDEIERSQTGKTIADGIRREDDWSIACAAARRDVTMVDVAISQLRNNSCKRPEDLVWALGEIRSDRAIPTLLDQLNLGNPFAAADAAEALGKIGDRSIKPHLFRALKIPDPWIQAHVIKALGMLGNLDDVPMLEPFVAEPPGRSALNLSFWAKEAIAEIRARDK